MVPVQPFVVMLLLVGFTFAEIVTFSNSSIIGKGNDVVTRGQLPRPGTDGPLGLTQTVWVRTGQTHFQIFKIFLGLVRPDPKLLNVFVGLNGLHPLGLILKSDRDSSVIQLSKLMIAGGIAGVLSWIISFPLDVIKSRMQADNLKRIQYKSMSDCYRQITSTNGRQVLLRGINPALLRAFPSNGALFTVHHICLQFLKDKI